MKKLTEQQINEVCELIEILATRISNNGNDERCLYGRCDYIGTIIKFLTNLIKCGYDDEMYTFEELISSTSKRINSKR